MSGRRRPGRSGAWGRPRADSPQPRSGHRARKRFGQHFLERAWIDKVVRAVAPTTDDVFIEVGPGHGALTFPLLTAARHVIAIEIDRDLAADLRATSPPNLTVLEADALSVSPDQLRATLEAAGLLGARLRLVGNLPYNVASPILFHWVAWTEAGLPFVDATVMLQREVADRIVAAPATAEYGVLAVLLRQVAAPTRLLALPPGAFRPAPEVHSAVLRLAWHGPDPVPRRLDVCRALVRAVFTRRRKTLSNALQAYPLPDRLPPAVVLATACIDGQRRPETLDIAEFVRLADAVSTEEIA